MSETTEYLVGGFAHWEDSDGTWWYRDAIGVSCVATLAMLPYLESLAAARREVEAVTQRAIQAEADLAPPAPETVTVGDDVYSRRGDTWYVGGFNIGLTLRHRELLDRIASDARVTQERDARIAELETQLQRALDGAVFHEKRAHHAEQERDAALRALEAMRLTPAQSAGSLQPTSQGKGLGKINGAEQAPAEEPADRRVTVDAAPAPIPLGAVVEVEGDDCSPYIRRDRNWLDSHDTSWWDDGGVAPLLTALYRARHPVATRETVERVRKALLQAFRATRVGEDFTENCTRAALTAAGFTLEGGA